MSNIEEGIFIVVDDHQNSVRAFRRIEDALNCAGLLVNEEHTAFILNKGRYGYSPLSNKSWRRTVHYVELER